MKVIKPMHGKPMIVHMLDRLKQSKSLNDIIICTSKESQDDPLVDIAEKEGVQCYRGDGDDVIGRLLGAAEKYDIDYVVNITADCPFVDPLYIDQVIDVYKKTNADLIRAWDLPHGAFSYGIKTDAMRKVIELKKSTDTEVWYQYFTDTGLFNVVDLDVKNVFHKRPGLRMTLDYPEDWKFFEAIFDELYEEGKVFALDKILQLLDDKPEIVELNKHCSAKFYKRYSRQSAIKLKKMQSVEKVLIIGCGSIGQRHIRTLRSLGITNIIALRSKKGHFQKLPEELGVTEVSSWDEAINEKPDVAIIANPTSLHLDYVFKLLPLVKGIFVEKPLSHSMEGIDKLVEEAAKHKTVLFVGHNLMFHPIVKSIKQYIDVNDLGNILNIQCQFGQWLPDWHPYEDFQKAYYARKDLGGGVALTLIHEIHMAIDLAGDPVDVAGMVSESELLKLDVDVISDVMVRHKSGCVSQIHLDYIQKPPHRNGLISFERGWISYDYNEHRVIAQGADDSAPATIWSDKTYDANDMYVDEIKEFIEYVEEHRMKNSFDIESAIESLKLVDALFESQSNKSIINIPDNKRFEF
jgi:predicted dehydrogenase/spore coat polysaccharide biosynthesis protein SpsF (cytidylyltransferase family)